jgi:hypothetical protein
MSKHPLSGPERVQIGNRDFEVPAIYRHARLPGGWIKLLSTAKDERGEPIVWWRALDSAMQHSCSHDEWLDMAGQKVGP